MGVGWLRDAEIFEGFPLGVEKRFCAVLPPVISTRRLTYMRGRLTRMIYLMS